MEFVMEHIDPCFKKAFEEMELLKKDIILPKGMWLLLHGCPVQLKEQTLVRADPTDILFALDMVEKRNSISLVKIDITGLLDNLKELNPEIDF